MDKSKIMANFSKTRKENGVIVKYFITNDSYEDEYGSLKSTYHAWRQEGKNEPVCLNPQCYLFSLDSALGWIDFGKWLTCPTCGKSHYKYVKDKHEVRKKSDKNRNKSRKPKKILDKSKIRPIKRRSN